MKKDTTIKQVIKKITKDITKYILELKIDEDDKYNVPRKKDQKR